MSSVTIQSLEREIIALKEELLSVQSYLSEIDEKISILSDDNANSGQQLDVDHQYAQYFSPLVVDDA